MIIIVVVIIASLGFSLSSMTQVAMAQVSPTAQNIINLVHSNCQEVTTGIGIVELLLSDYVTLKHESSNLVVLNAKMFVVDTINNDRYIENDFIWQAVDGFKGQGYTVDDVVLSGEGNELNPHEFIVGMSK